MEVIHELDTAFFRNLADSTFHNLETYRQLMESKLQSALEEDKANREKKVASYHLENEEEEYAEHSIEMDEHEIKYNMFFKNFMRYSFIVLLKLVTEDWLRKLCFATKDFKNLIPDVVPDKRYQDVLKFYKQYLTNANVVVSETTWSPVFDVGKVRDCIVHCSGDTSRSRDRIHLRQMAARNIGIRIGYSEKSTSTEPLYKDENMLVVSEQYCKSALRDAKNLIDKLCDNLGLTYFRLET